MSQIVPTILTNDKNLYMRQYALYSTFAKRVQVDICDGIFTPTQSIDVSNAYHQADWAPMDLHMMVMNPSQFLPFILKIKPSLCIFHAETNENLLPIFATLKQNGIKTGVAILKQTFPGRIEPYLKEADHCLIFAGRLGASGGEADMMQIEKIPIVKDLVPNIEIGWDGGANLKNVRALAHADVDIINVGAALSTSPDPKKSFDELTADLEKFGVVI